MTKASQGLTNTGNDESGQCVRLHERHADARKILEEAPAGRHLIQAQAQRPAIIFKARRLDPCSCRHLSACICAPDCNQNLNTLMTA